MKDNKTVPREREPRSDDYGEPVLLVPHLAVYQVTDPESVVTIRALTQKFSAVREVVRDFIRDTVMADQARYRPYRASAMAGQDREVLSEELIAKDLIKRLAQDPQVYVSLLQNYPSEGYFLDNVFAQVFTYLKRMWYAGQSSRDDLSRFETDVVWLMGNRCAWHDIGSMDRLMSAVFGKTGLAVTRQTKTAWANYDAVRLAIEGDQVTVACMSESYQRDIPVYASRVLAKNAEQLHRAVWYQKNVLPTPSDKEGEIWKAREYRVQLFRTKTLYNLLQFYLSHKA